ncbi:hypothetical protein pb186bvf_008742 [Paramecium bursaria]
MFQQEKACIKNIVWDLMPEPVYNQHKSFYNIKIKLIYQRGINIIGQFEKVQIYTDYLKNGMIKYQNKKIFDLRLRKNTKLRSKLIYQKGIELFGFDNHYYFAK